LEQNVRSTIQKRDAKGEIRHGAEWLALWSDPDSMKTHTELRQQAATRDAAAARERGLAAAARSLSGDPRMRVLFGASSDGGLAGLSADAVGGLNSETLSAVRGAVDSYALIRRHHDPRLRDSGAPSDPTQAALVEMCEHVRCEALGARRFPGVAANLVARHRDRMRKADLLNAHLASLIPLAEGLRMVLRDSLLDFADPSIATAGFWMWDRWLRARFADRFTALRAAIDDQRTYAVHSRGLVEAVRAEVSGALRRRLSPSAGQAGENVEDASGNERRSEDEAGDILEPGGELPLDPGAHPREEVFSTETVVPPREYRIYTTAHDLVIDAAELIDPAAARNSRADLDRRRAEFQRDFARVVARLQRRLMARQLRDWSFDLDEGLVDAARLDRVVVNPGFASAYKQEVDSEFRDTAVVILIDNSGSMRGKPIEIAFLACEMISAALERCGVTSEILGFTTRGWKGGESAKDWERAGRPGNPGRLNDALHIIYKSADQPMRRSRLTLCAMLDSEILKENVDGEALLWASRRLFARPETRKVLIVISDGAPVDQATLAENEDKAILDRHLRAVIAQIEASGSIELAAIGVRHEVGTYYRNSVQIEKLEALGASLVKMIDEFLTR